MGRADDFRHCLDCDRCDSVDTASGQAKCLLACPVGLRLDPGWFGEPFLGLPLCPLGRERPLVRTRTPLLCLGGGPRRRSRAGRSRRGRRIGLDGCAPRFRLLGIDHVAVYERQPTVRKADFRFKRGFVSTVRSGPHLPEHGVMLRREDPEGKRERGHFTDTYGRFQPIG